MPQRRVKVMRVAGRVQRRDHPHCGSGCGGTRVPREDGHGAAQCFLAVRGARAVACAKLIHDPRVRYIFCGHDPALHSHPACATDALASEAR